MAKGLHSTKKGRSVFSPQKTERGWAQVRKFLSHPLAQFTLFSAFILATVAVMTAGFNVRDVSLNLEQVGKPALRPVVATRDFVYAERDTGATEQLRERVATAVPPVYDWNEGEAEQLRDQVRRAMESMRTALAQNLRQQVVPERPGETAEERIAKRQSMSDAQIIAAADAATLAELSQPLRTEHFDPIFPVEVSDQEFEQLARAGFDPQFEGALGTLVLEIMSNLIVPSGRIIEEERDRGIYLRRMREGRVLLEYHLTDLRGRVLGEEAVPGLLREKLQQRSFEVATGPLRTTLLSLADDIIRPNTIYNEAITLEKRANASAAVDDVVVRQEFSKGQVIVDKGELITAQHVRIWEEMISEGELFTTMQVIAGLVLLSLLVFVTFYLFGRQNIEGFRLAIKDLAFLGVTMLLFLLIVRVGKATSYAIAEQMTDIGAQTWLFIIPVAGAGMLVRLILESEHAVVFSLVFSVLAGLIMDESLFYNLFTLIGCLVGANFVRQVRNRLALMWSGLVIGTVNVLLLLGYMLMQGELFQTASIVGLVFGFSGGIASGFLVSAILPVFEAGFGYTTDIKLLELANLNHPLLRELILRSPGSYHHSMMVGSLCEAAAEEINCNSLLARVGAYYHDVGKAKNPGYFAENQKYGENPHDKLKPNMSALIIKAHVKDGVEMARQHRLPEEIIDFIEQHHGTSLISYFYHKAKQLEDPDIPEVDEKDYRYPGPRPQMRETAICLLADGIEAASRAMPNKTPARLKGLVQTMINRAFTDGQLDECDLTLKDLNAIAQAFTRILTGIYHHRPEYPDSKKKESKSERQTGEHKAAKSAQRTKTNTSPSDKPAEAEANEASTKDEDGHDDDAQHARSEESDDRDSGSGDSGTASDDGEDSSDADGQGRASLPRLGSS